MFRKMKNKHVKNKNFSGTGRVEIVTEVWGIYKGIHVIINQFCYDYNSVVFSVWLSFEIKTKPADFSKSKAKLMIIKRLTCFR